MSDEKKNTGIQIEFFKGIIGAMLCLIIYEINEMIGLLSEITTGTESIFGDIATLAVLGTLFFPAWYWIISPVVMYILED